MQIILSRCLTKKRNEYHDANKSKTLTHEFNMKIWECGNNTMNSNIANLVNGAHPRNEVLDHFKDDFNLNNDSFPLQFAGQDDYNIFNYLPLNTLEEKIENFEIPSHNRADEEINIFVDNFFDMKEMKEDANASDCKKCDVINKVFKDDSKVIISTIRQIEELEKLLQQTKLEILRKSFEFNN